MLEQHRRMLKNQNGGGGQSFNTFLQVAFFKKWALDSTKGTEFNTNTNPQDILQPSHLEMVYALVHKWEESCPLDFLGLTRS